MDKIIQMLMEEQDMEYAQFHRRLVPTIEPESIIGVRTPILRKMAKQISKDSICQEFLNELPHKYYEENQLHGFIISEIKTFENCIEELEIFLPYINNWATCDQTSPKIFKKNKDRLLPYINKWISSDECYTVRFAIGMLKVPMAEGLEITRKTGGENIDDVIMRYIKFKTNKKKYRKIWRSCCNN